MAKVAKLVALLIGKTPARVEEEVGQVSIPDIFAPMDSRTGYGNPVYLGTGFYPREGEISHPSGTVSNGKGRATAARAIKQLRFPYLPSFPNLDAGAPGKRFHRGAEGIRKDKVLSTLDTRL